MSRNGSGVYSLNTAGQPVVSGTTITSTAFNLATADIATALTQSVCVDGQTTTTGLIPFAAGLKSTTLNEFTATNGLPLQGVTASPITNASAGYVGEYLETVVLVGAGINLGTGVPTDIATLSISAGDWDVWGTVASAMGAGSITSNIVGGINTSANTLPTPPTNCYAQSQQTYPANANQSMPLGAYRFNVATTTTLHLVMRLDFSVNTATGYGFIAARRRR